MSLKCNSNIEQNDLDYLKIKTSKWRYQQVDTYVKSRIDNQEVSFTECLFSNIIIIIDKVDLKSMDMCTI